MKLFSIEANIGVGKSTLIENIKSQFPDVLFVQEPVKEWSEFTDENNLTLLEKFYSDPKSFAFSFQMMAFISRVSSLREHIRNNPDKIIITERSVFADRQVFAKMLFDDGCISQIDYKIYNHWFDELTRDIQLDGIIYLTTDIDTNYNRVLKRNRSGEVISKKYLTSCKSYHDEWINNSFINCLKIDYTNPENVVERIREFTKN
jgi:deoxyadenosine/deoxycytidine kinase